MVVTDGAAVYQGPDFDSAVVDYLGYQYSVYILKKSVSGRGGMGLFHRVRYKNKSGYLPDTDVRLSAKDIESEKDRQKGIKDTKKNDPNPKSKAWDQDDQAAMGAQTVYFTRYAGGTVGLVGFTEKFSGKKLSANMPMGGLRLTGPGVLFDGPPLDFNIWFSFQKPSYYKKITDDAVSGFMLMGDVMAMFPLIDSKSRLLSYGMGLMWTYTNYKVAIDNSHFDSQEIRLGFDFDLGFAQKISKALVRADVKYYWEKTQYLGYFLSVQVPY